MKEQYDTIILGATFYGCGLASKKKDCLLLEHSIHPGSDFIYSSIPGLTPLKAPLFPESRKLQDDLISTKAITENGIQMAALAPFFAKWCIAGKLEILFSADPVKVEKNSITVMTVAGKKRFSFNTLIDARPVKGEKKFLTGFALVPEGVSPGKYGEITYHKCEPLSRMALSMELPGSSSWSQARKCFYEAWKKRPDFLAEGKLLWTASSFLYPQFGNYLEALEAGLKGGDK